MERISRNIIILSVLVFGMTYVSAVSAQTSDETPVKQQDQTQLQDGSGVGDMNQYRHRNQSGELADHDQDGIPNGQDADYSGPGKDAQQGKRGEASGHSDGSRGKAQSGAAFVDRDGDGICDYQKDGTAKGKMLGKGKGKGHADGKGGGKGAMMRGRGPGFVDSNGDGACDNAESGTSTGKGGAGSGNGKGKGGK